MGHADFEIEALFDKFDVDGDRILNEEEVAMMKDELEADEVILWFNIDNNITNIFIYRPPLSKGWS